MVTRVIAWIIGLLLLLFIGFVLVIAYISHDMESSRRSMEEYFDWQSEPAPLSSHELRYSDSLKKEGIDIRIERLYFDRLERYYDKEITVEISPSKYVYPDTDENKFIELRRHIVTDLIKIVPDSVLAITDQIKTHYVIYNRKSGGNCSQELFKKLQISVSYKVKDSLR